VNPYSALVWAWRTFRGHSITFAALFGFGILGISAVSAIREFLSREGAPWYIWLAAPMVLVAVLAKKELAWVPDAEERKKWARGIFFGSIAAAVVVAIFGPEPPPKPAAPLPKAPSFHKVPH
jgi:hypothetical protein